MYIVKHRQVAADDPRTFLLHPNEANRDSAPEYDEWKHDELGRQLGRVAASLIKRKPREGEYMSFGFNLSNKVADYAGTIAINLAGFKAGWDPARIHETTEFIDVWFNCILCENYAAMAELATRLGNVDDAGMFTELALTLEQAMAKHYIPEARNDKGAFYSIYNDKSQRVDTIGNLMPLLLPSLPAKQLRSIFILMDEAFNTPYVLPSVAADDKANFDPHYEERYSHWRTPVWPVANDKAKRGLDKHVDREDIPAGLNNDAWRWFHKVHESNLGMIEATGDYAEHYNPITGMGQRMDRSRGHVFGVVGHMPI